MSLNKSNIDYLRKEILYPATGLTGYTLNIVTGCKHQEQGICNVKDCYARRMVEHGRLKGHPSYPYGFKPTFHPERIRKYGGAPKLLFLDDMGDCGCDDLFRYVNDETEFASPEFIASEMLRFALLNPQHIILLLTKRPEWYVFAEWPPNVYCGVTCTSNADLDKLFCTYPIWWEEEHQWWLSLEPWLDEKPPKIDSSDGWLVIGGLSGPNARPVSVATLKWLQDPSIQARRFTKDNAYKKPEHGPWIRDYPREYPDSWRVEEATQ